MTSCESFHALASCSPVRSCIHCWRVACFGGCERCVLSFVVSCLISRVPPGKGLAPKILMTAPVSALSGLPLPATCTV